MVAASAAVSPALRISWRDLEFDRQAVAIPAGNVGRAFAAQAFDT